MGPWKKFLLRKTEANVDRLSTLALVVTLVDMVFMWWTFIESGYAQEGEFVQVPEAMMYLLWGSLFAYATPKEINRWHHPEGHESKRIGQAFIFLWVCTVIAMAAIWKLTNGRFVLPDGIGPTVGGVLAVFTATTVSREAHKCRNGNDKKRYPETEKAAAETDAQDSTADRS